MPPAKLRGMDNRVVVSEAFEMYRRDYILFKSQSRSTEQQHAQTSKNLISFIGEDIPIAEVTFDIVRDWKMSMERSHLSALTVRGYLIKLRNVLGYMHLVGIDCLDPARIVLPKRPDTVPEVITPDEVEKLIDGTPKLRNKALIALLYSTGLRISECCALNRMDVKNEFFTVIGKNNVASLHFIDETARYYLDEYLKERATGRKTYWKDRGKLTDRIRYFVPPDNHPALFLNDRGQRLTPHMAQEVFKRARRRAGLTLNVHPHTMRHTFATDLLLNGADIVTINKHLGHKSIETTMQYLHIFNPQLEESYKKYHTVLKRGTI